MAGAVPGVRTISGVVTTRVGWLSSDSRGCDGKGVLVWSRSGCVCVLSILFGSFELLCQSLFYG